jgi:pyruvate dehydrogenase E1 component
MATKFADAREEKIAAIEALDTRLRWLSSWTVHNANHIRKKRDGLKVGGHQASCASMTAIMAALYFHALRPNDKVSVKPHAGPVLQAIHYMLGNQSLEQLQQYRAPRTKSPLIFPPGRWGWAWLSRRFPAWFRTIWSPMAPWPRPMRGG